MGWWYITNCSAQVGLLVEHLSGKLQHHRCSLPCSLPPQPFHAGAVTANTHRRDDVSGFPSLSDCFLIPTHVTASQSVPFHFPFPFTVPLALQNLVCSISCCLMPSAAVWFLKGKHLLRVCDPVQDAISPSQTLLTGRALLAAAAFSTALLFSLCFSRTSCKFYSICNREPQTTTAMLFTKFRE